MQTTQTQAESMRLIQHKVSNKFFFSLKKNLLALFVGFVLSLDSTGGMPFLSGE